jgi:hypothetical protein
MRVRIIATAAASLAIAAGGLVVTTGQASAATCLTIAKYTNVNPAASAVWTTTGKSACTDLSAAATKRYNDRVQGWYVLSSTGKWKAGSRGFVAVTTSNSGWKILLSDLRDGATVRGETLNHNQDVQYVW